MPLTVSTHDYHTAGEPFRIVSGGVPPLRGATILDKRTYAAEHLDRYRKLLVNEPRGHADMYGCFVTEPDDDGADLGVVFFHNAGYSTACGHGTIALATWALEQGVIEATGDETVVTIDVPSGRLRTVVTSDGGSVRSVRFRNVPSFVAGRDLAVHTSRGDVRADVSYGGAFYASVRASDLGLAVTPEHLTQLIAAGREIKAALNAAGAAEHPKEDRLSGIYGVIFYDEQDSTPEQLRQRNVTVFADGEVDRSPCGSGTSARLALLAEDGLLGPAAPNRMLLHTSIVGTTFGGFVLNQEPLYGRNGWVTEVEGSASLTGFHHFVLREDDALPEGFLLR
jgi:proline racemase